MSNSSVMDFVTTYGWAMLIIVIVAGTLTYYGIFSPDVLLSSRFCTDSEVYLMRSVCDKMCVPEDNFNISIVHECYKECFKDNRKELGC